ncbi:MAG: hypothetical protein EH225_07535 [Calditrichaeota bacterium]|nr:hypothetical protein [Calditrichota bacterium]RQW03079.1 MAG: hypothetical protein EH225_07535 [Calditrichota bacterium]
MRFNRIHLNQEKPGSSKKSPDYSKRYFFWPFKKKKTRSAVRNGALQPDEVKRRVKELGVGKQVEIVRIGYDGSIDDMPVIVEIIDISDDSFTGRIINLERQMIESATRNLVYAKKGGGVIEFFFKDGDIKEIILSRDQELLEQERNIPGLKEILTALDTGDQVLIAFYDEKHKGTINTEGTLLEKDEQNEVFTVQIEKINRIELEQKIKRTFDIRKDLVIDIEMV